METVCGGDISLDLSAGDRLNLIWEVPIGLRVQGWEGTEFEFRLSTATECESTYQDVPQQKISFDFIDESGGDEHAQIYSHDESESFVEIDEVYRKNTVQCAWFTFDRKSRSDC